MRDSASPALTRYSPELAGQLCRFVSRAAPRPDLKAVVEANHDNNRWWPTFVRDWRVRMAVAGWSSRVSYAMIGSYADVVAHTDDLGWEKLTTLDNESLSRLVRPIGLPTARIRYLRSLTRFIDQAEYRDIDLAAVPASDLIASLHGQVDGAGFNIAQCAVLYARGYHCGIIPVDSGMVTRLAALLGIKLPPGPASHEHLRKLLELCVNARADFYREMASDLNYQVMIPPGVAPTWFAHLTLIYFKRLYLNRLAADLCPSRPVCAELFGCHCPSGGIAR